MNMMPSGLNSITYIVDDDFSVRDSLQTLIETPNRKVRCFENATQFIDGYQPDIPGCLLLDLRMPGIDGLQLQESLSEKHIEIPIIFISGNAEVSDTAKAFRNGAVDFFEKPFDNKKLLERIQESIKKDVVFRQRTVDKTKAKICYSTLTTREKEVLQLIINSYSNKEAARVLEISPRTIDAHRARVMEKMQAENLAALVSMVIYNDLLTRASDT